MKTKWLFSCAVVAGAVLSACAASPESTSPSTSSLQSMTNVGNLGRVPTAGWIAHTIRGDGVVLTIKTPPTWDHTLTPAMNDGGATTGGVTYFSTLPLSSFCYGGRNVDSCAPGRTGSLSQNSGVLSVTEDAPNSASIPSPILGEQMTSIDGYPAAAKVPTDAKCTSLAGPMTYYYDVALWVPAGAQLRFCINGPEMERLEATITTIVESARFRPDPHSTAVPLGMAGAIATNGGYSSIDPTCSRSEITSSVTADVLQAQGRTTIGVTTMYRLAGSKLCGVPALEACGFDGDLAIYGPLGTVLWTWEPIARGQACMKGVWLLPVTNKVPTWSVPTKLLKKGTYTVRMVHITNGVIDRPVLASTTFRIT